MIGNADHSGMSFKINNLQFYYQVLLVSPEMKCNNEVYLHV